MCKLGDFCLKRILYWVGSRLVLLSACKCCSLTKHLIVHSVCRIRDKTIVNTYIFSYRLF